MLARQQRLPLDRLREVKKSGRRLGDAAVTIKWLATIAGPSRAAVLVAKSAVAKSSDRNQLKRRGRAILASQFPAFKLPVDLILWLGRSARERPFTELEEKIVFYLRQAKIL